MRHPVPGDSFAKSVNVNQPNSKISEWIAPEDERSRCERLVALGDALVDAAHRWGDREAIVYRGQPSIDPVSWTFTELDRLSGRLAAGLLARGYRKGDRIAVWGPNHPEWILLEYAIAKAGLAIVALNPLYRSAELAFALSDSRARGIFHADCIGGHTVADTIAGVRDDLPDLQHVHGFSSIWSEFLSGGSVECEFADVDPAQTFMIQYTSGTTGVPKAVRLSHSALTTTGHNSYRGWGLGEASRVCFGFPLFHVGGSGHSIPGACQTGATAFPLYIFKPSTTLNILEAERCTTFIGVPTMLIAMLDDPSFASRDLAHLDTIIVGGAPVTLDLLERCRDDFGAEVVNCYGQTETSGVTATTRLDDGDDKKISTSGRPLVGVSVSIRDQNGKPVNHGALGELHYRGPGGMIGYGSSEDDSEVGDGWIASGDLARMDSDGFVAIDGRKKEMIIRGGENLSPLEIESYMQAHPAIRDVAVIGVPDPKYGEVACAVVCLQAGATVQADEIRSWCAEQISRWKVPEYVEFVEEFPMTPSGKIKKFILQENMIERLNLVANTSSKIGDTVP